MGLVPSGGWSPRRLIEIAGRLIVVFGLGAVMTPGWAIAETDWTGTVGYPCFDDGSCVIGYACNARFYCQRCGGAGQPACPDGTRCAEGHRGFRPIVAADGLAYCGLDTEPYAFAPDYCGKAGFPACPDGRCFGASRFDGRSGMCIECGLMEQSCCFETAPRLCDDGECNPSSGRCEWPREEQELPSSPPPTADDRSELPPPVEDGFSPGAPPAGLSDCSCFSTDGRNGTCRANGCVEPPNFSGTCYWYCRDASGNAISIRGRDGQLLSP